MPQYVITFKVLMFDYVGWLFVSYNSLHFNQKSFRAICGWLMSNSWTYHPYIARHLQWLAGSVVLDDLHLCRVSVRFFLMDEGFKSQSGAQHSLKATLFQHHPNKQIPALMLCWFSDIIYLCIYLFTYFFIQYSALSLSVNNTVHS